MSFRRDFATAALLGGFATVLLLAGGNLPSGTAARMGPGFIPKAAAIGLLLVSAAIALRGILAMRRATRRANDELPPFQWNAAASVSGSILVFALLIQPAGLLAAAAVTVFLTSLSQVGHLPERIALAGGLAAFAGIVFPVALGLPISILPQPL